MFFRKKQSMRSMYDDKLISLMSQARTDWFKNRDLLRLSFEQNNELEAQTKAAQAKYFFLFREAKKRQIRIKE
ncbi:YaaL family protein [Domibacillus sp. DTU_2020_1001157_1_SI_ALB_TIR_016]|uniref:YaaL family protein n=1 Tax=Domibacillus sp. DTU_2020_1001157_1_SI_ALB_TIR_016 TaxID=3077789 RepID=UPI0028F0FC71|nr:YaaL family protein [Domibacillus sp. DTU_2020_1001157_1_SI_ALB_TIR_016]WNS80830.1 YaaL family protein [Domibacillus sp. DTU_2020_1001157_1_SI_ALB_TIR_016]